MSLCTHLLALANYYWHALLRSGATVEGWIVSWSVAPGLLLVVCITFYEFLPRIRSLSEGGGVMSPRRLLVAAGRHLKPITYGSFMFLVIMFGIAFVQDAPEQIRIRDEELAKHRPKPNPCDSLHPVGDTDERGKRTREIEELLNSIMQGRTKESTVAVQSIIVILRKSESPTQTIEELASDIDKLIGLISTAREEQRSIADKYQFSDIFKCIDAGIGINTGQATNVDYLRTIPPFLRSFSDEVLTNATGWRLLKYTKQMTWLEGQFGPDYLSWNDGLRHTLVAYSEKLK